MHHNRRLFLKRTGLFASGIALVGIGCGEGGSNHQSGTSDSTGSDAPTAAHTLTQFGIQLYTVRDVMPKDPKGVIKQLASYGYKQIEGYEHSELGIWWGMGHKGYKQYLDDLGLSLISTHCDVSKDFEKKAAEAAEVGMKYLIQPWVGPQKTLDDYKKTADSFNRLGEICKKNGIRFAYHNHGYSFEKMEDQYPQDIFMQNTDPDTVDFEMDIYWVVLPGEDPSAWLNKYPNRFRLCHIKDRLKDAPAGEADASTEVGNGSIDFKSILKTAEDNGMQYYMVEQEKYDTLTPLQSAEASAKYLKTLEF